MEYLYYVYHLGKHKIEVIGIDEEIGDEIKGDIIETNYKDDIGIRWSNRKSHLNLSEYDISKEYIPIKIENMWKLNFNAKESE